MQCTPVFGVEGSRPVRKMRSFPRCWRKLSTISLALKIFRRLKAISIAHYKPNATHSVFSVETIPTVRKMRPFTPFWRKLCVVSILLEIFRRLNATSIAFYTSKAIHAVFGVERSTPVRKMRSFTRFWRELRAISLLFETFRRLNSISIAFYTPIATHAVFSVESCPTVRTMRPFTPFWRKLCVVSILLEIFRRLNATSIAFYTSKAIPAVLASKEAHLCEKCDHLLDFEENWELFRFCLRYFDV